MPITLPYSLNKEDNVICRENKPYARNEMITSYIIRNSHAEMIIFTARKYQGFLNVD